jgi:hypothetical protein
MELNNKSIEERLDEATKKTGMMDPLIRDLELKIKNERITDCETS